MISNFAKGVNELPPNLKQELFDQLSKLAETSSDRPIAAFDADGTLWDSDVGEDFFQYQIDHCGFSFEKDPWDIYKEKKAINPPDAYLWLAQINKNQSIDQVRKWAQEATASKPPQFFQSTFEIIQHLKALNFEIYIVTASIKWAVEPGGALLGIDQEHVLGVNTKIENNMVTEINDPPVTWREGKAEALLKKTNDRAPSFCAGNTRGDTFLLKASKGLALAFQTSSQGDKLFDSEMELQREADHLGFLKHHYRS